MTDATIFALASGPARGAGVAIVRLSGSGTAGALAALGCALPEPRKAVRARFKHPVSAEVVDDGLLLWFPAPASYTGEDVAEFHIHGGRAVIDGLLDALNSISSLRPAEPGEFTRRAFLHGKMDLTQAEALADLIAAETCAQARQALRQMNGALKNLYDDWRQRLIRATAHLEAVIDFPDEDLPPDVAARVWSEVDRLRADITAHLDDGRRGERIRDGLAITIIGPPNAGKSSLLNALAQRDAAIVAATPGTTRDVIEVHMDIDGYAVTLADTAGLRDAIDAIEDEGIRRARARAQSADMKIAVFDGAFYPTLDATTQALIDDDTVVVVNKADLLRNPETRDKLCHFISVQSGFGMTEFLEALAQAVKARVASTNTAPLTRARHRKALEECRDALTQARQIDLAELAAEDLRRAARELGRITGRIDVDDVLDVVFREFCIGK